MYSPHERQLWKDCLVTARCILPAALKMSLQILLSVAFLGSAGMGDGFFYIIQCHSVQGKVINQMIQGFYYILNPSPPPINAHSPAPIITPSAFMVFCVSNKMEVSNEPDLWLFNFKLYNKKWKEREEKEKKRWYILASHSATTGLRILVNFFPQYWQPQWNV